MSATRKGASGVNPGSDTHSDLAIAGTHATRPTDAQRRYLVRGLTQAGGKLPLFDRDGREVPKQTIEACLAHGWAEPWTHNPIRPDWLVCRLTEAGYRALGAVPPQPHEPARGRDR